MNEFNNFNSIEIQKTIERNILDTAKHSIYELIRTFVINRATHILKIYFHVTSIFTIHMWYSDGVEIIHGNGKADKYNPMTHHHFNLPTEDEVEFLKLKKQEKTLQMQKSKVNSFLRYLISPCETVSDLYTVFPSSLQDFLPERDNSKISLTSEQISSLQQYAKENPILQTIQFRNFLLS